MIRRFYRRFAKAREKTIRCSERWLLRKDTGQSRDIQISAARDDVQNKQVIVVEVFGEPLALDPFLDALAAGKE
jgi:hypothetical protein